MKKIFAILAASVFGVGVFSSHGQTNQNEFRQGEVDISPFATYVDKAGGKWGVGAAATYYLTKNLGLGAATYWTDFNTTLFENAAAEAYFRFARFDRVAPYAVGSIGYQFNAGYWFETIGGGVQVRILERLSGFSDLQYRIADNWRSQDGVFLRVGVSISF